MRREKGFTLVELLVVIGIIALLASILVPTLTRATELANQAICMANLSAISRAIGVYKNQYDDKWPWIQKTDGWTSGWGWEVPTGQHRDFDPYEDPNNPRDRAITALMFLLVRDGQHVGLFTCPSDDDVSPEPEIKWDHDDNEQTEDEYYWDFSDDTHVSYSWQAPIIKKGYRLNGVSDDETDAVVMADKSPLYDDETWSSEDLSKPVSADVIRRNMSQNHDGGRKVIALRVGMNVVREDRPDIGPGRDHIYTASGERLRGTRRWGTARSVQAHFSVRDSFLIGPVAGRDEPADEP